MVRGSGVLLGVGMLMLAGCVVSHGPRMANALDVNLEVIVRWIDGTMESDTFKPGMLMAIGNADWENDPYTPILIEEVVIKEAGQLLHQFDAEEVRLLIEKQESESGWWCIDQERVYLSLSPNSYPDTRKECSKGKRLWTWENGRFYKGSRESP